MTGRFISTGSVLVDLPLAMPHLPERGGDVLGSAQAPTPGGGFNVLAAAARQQVTAALLSPIGDGPQGRSCVAALAEEGVEVLLPLVAGRDTGLCVTVTEPDGERTFLTAPGVEDSPTRAQLDSAAVSPDDVVYVSGYDLAYPGGAVLTAWIADLPPEARVIFDPGPLVGEISSELLVAVGKRSDVLTLNERETAVLGGASAVRALVGVRPVILFRDGPQGCLVDEGTTRTHISAPAVHAIDSTGAGDAHTGVLAAELLHGLPIHEAVRRANTAAALTVTKAGPATSPTREELEAALG